MIELKLLSHTEKDVIGFGIHSPDQIKSYPEQTAKSLLNQNNGRDTGCEIWEEIKPAKTKKKAENNNMEVNHE